MEPDGWVDGGVHGSASARAVDARRRRLRGARLSRAPVACVRRRACSARTASDPSRVFCVTRRLSRSLRSIFGSTLILIFDGSGTRNGRSMTVNPSGGATWPGRTLTRSSRSSASRCVSRRPCRETAQSPDQRSERRALLGFRARARGRRSQRDGQNRPRPTPSRGPNVS